MTSRFLWAKSVAAWRDGYGVTLLRGKKATELQAEKFPLSPEAEGPDFLEPGDSALTARLAPIAKALVDDHAYNGTSFAFVVLHEGKVVAERYREGLSDIFAPTGIAEWQGDERAAITLNDLMQMQSGCAISSPSYNRLPT
ncbi:MAG: hypothetical protein IJ156_01730 [Bacteroidales bacterium]|nr:hypothetical protein [Bacteroidales bacterium]